MSSIQSFNNQPPTFSADRSHTKTDKTQSRFSKTRSERLSSKKDDNLNASKAFQEMSSLSDQAKVTAGVAKNRFKSSQTSGQNSFFHNNTETFPALDNGLSVSEEAEIEPLFLDQEIISLLEKNACELLTPQSVITTKLDAYANQKPDIAACNSTPNLFDSAKDVRMKRQLEEGDPLSDIQPPIKIKNCPQEHDYESVVSNVLKMEARRDREKIRLKKYHDKFKTDPEMQKKYLEKKQRSVEIRRKKLQEDPEFKQRFNQQKKDYLQKVNANPVRAEQIKHKLKEYRQRYQTALKADPEKQKKKLANTQRFVQKRKKRLQENPELKKLINKKRNEHLKKVNANPVRAEQNRQKAKEYRQRVRKRLENDPEKKAAFQAKNRNKKKKELAQTLPPTVTEASVSWRGDSSTQIDGCTHAALLNSLPTLEIDSLSNAFLLSVFCEMEAQLQAESSIKNPLLE